MQYLPKRKFLVTKNSDGTITAGAAVSGFLVDLMDSTNPADLYTCLLESPTGDDWELVVYDPNATNANNFRSIIGSSAGGSDVLPTDVPGLFCTLVAHPNSYVLSTGAGLAPDVRSESSTGVGAGADVGTGSPNSLAVNSTVRDNSPRSISIGGWAGASETVSVGFEASAENFTDNFSYATVNTGCSVAIGYRAKVTAGGEVALGSANASHMSGIPLMTDDPSAGGTFLFKSVAGFDADNYVNILSALVEGNETYKPPYPASSPQWVIHVQGTIVARATDAANGKVVKVEWVTGGTLAQTVLTQGANNISLGLALNGMRLQATVGAVAGLKLAGYLHVTKVALPQ